MCTIGSDGLLCDEGAVLDGEYHEVLFVDYGVLDAYGFFALFGNTGVDVMKHALDEFILAEKQGLNAHCLNKL